MAFRKAILTALKETPGEWVSGEALSQGLSVSRTTVWKYVRQLRSEGYAVETSPRKGYRLSAPPDLLSFEEISPGLQTRVFGREHYFYFPEIESTNSYARHLADTGYPEGTLIVAESQSAGKGRRGRHWHSEPGLGVYFSLILRPQLPLNELSRINLAIAVAITRALQAACSLKTGIKWPNDILVNGRKMAGILTEAVTDMDGLEYVVTGIGLNINHLDSDFPETLRPYATSVRIETGQEQSRMGIFQELLLHLEMNCQHLMNSAFESILADYRSLSLAIGREIQFDSEKGPAVGRGMDIDSNGFLIVQDSAGGSHKLMSGEISLKAASE